VDYKKPNLGLEPLPDIDFNIRSGNTLVGYATLADLDKGEQGGLFGDEEKQAILEEADVVSRTYARFKDAQLVMHSDPKQYKDAKDALNERLEVLNRKLNKYLAVTYLGSTPSEKAYEKWLASHQPFHWLAEYYTTIAQGGFDVIIGNPPYVEYSSSNVDYAVRPSDFGTFSSRNLYSYVFERSKGLSKSGSRVGMIVQISSISTPTMETMTKEVRKNAASVWISNYATRPSYLFDGVTMNLTIILAQVEKRESPSLTYSTHYLRWNPEYRPYLFQIIPYNQTDTRLSLFSFGIPKLTHSFENDVLEKLIGQDGAVSSYVANNEVRRNKMHYRTAGGRYFKIFLDRDFGSESKSNKAKSFQRQYDLHALIAVVSSNLWWWYYTLHFDMYNCKDYMIFSFRFDYDSCLQIPELSSLGKALTVDLVDNAEKKTQSYATTGDRSQLIFRPALSKPIIDEIDKVLAKHYGFTPEELDFIINYDIKYRMGKELEAEE